VSIRWKLFLILFLLTAGAIAVVLLVAEREFRGWFRGEIQQRFESQLTGLLKARTERLAQLRETGTRLASHPAIKAELTGEGTPGQREAFLREFLETRPTVPGSSGRTRPGELRSEPKNSGTNQRPDPVPPGQAAKPGSRPGETSARKPLLTGQSLPVMGVINLQGDAKDFGRIIPRSRARRAQVAKRIGELSRHPAQETAYVVFTSEEDQRSRVQEVVVTPVRGDDGTVLGWFFLGRDAETEVGRSFQQAQKTSGRDGRSGLVAGGQWFVKGVSEAEAEAITAKVSEDFWTGGKPERIEIDGRHSLIIARDLNPGSPLGKGHQVALFPLDSLITAFTRIHTIVGILGFCAVLVTSLVAFILARRFSRPIAELVAGTERIRQGNLDEDVMVRSKDEFGTLAGAFNAMTRDLALKERYREVLGKISDPAVAQQLIEGDLELGGEVRNAAVLFCDIRGFTAMTEGMNPAEVIEFVNEHMTAMTELVYLHGGVVDKFVGDLIMAVFGVPTSQGDDALRAARCALAMLAERKCLNAQTGRIVEVGIGIAYGELVAGCMGSTDRLNYTVLGDRVNLAFRLCSAAGPGEVLSDQKITDSLDGSIHAEPREPIQLKGFSAPMDSFALATS